MKTIDEVLNHHLPILYAGMKRPPKASGSDLLHAWTNMIPRDMEPNQLHRAFCAWGRKSDTFPAPSDILSLVDSAPKDMTGAFWYAPTSFCFGGDITQTSSDWRHRHYQAVSKMSGGKMFEEKRVALLEQLSYNAPKESFDPSRQ